MDFPKAKALVKISHKPWNDKDTNSSFVVSDELLPQGDYVAVPKAEWEAFEAFHTAAPPTGQLDERRMIVRSKGDHNFPYGIAANAGIELLAMMLYYDHHNAQTGWLQENHATRTKYRTVAAGYSEFPE